MSLYDQLKQLERNISNTQAPDLLFVMNKRYREIEEEIERINNITVNYEDRLEKI